MKKNLVIVKKILNRFKDSVLTLSKHKTLSENNVSRLCIDHCHIKDNINYLKSAISYLEREKQ